MILPIWPTVFAGDGKIPVFPFAIGLMDDRIQVVARSRNEAINVGDICAALGGGGHAYAASASVRTMTVHEVRDVILRHLYAQGLSRQNRARIHVFASRGH